MTNIWVPPFFPIMLRVGYKIHNANSKQEKKK